MTTLLMVLCVICVVLGAGILGWYARSWQLTSTGAANPADRGEVGAPNNGD